ncbi:hypothetical protein CfB38_4420 [Citrobacter freundii]|nr:hypothetical protein CfB38_4420 [Citrobacter freundii]
MIWGVLFVVVCLACFCLGYSTKSSKYNKQFEGRNKARKNLFKVKKK